MFDRLLVPLDGSRLAESVLPAVKRLGALPGARVQLLHVIERSAPESIHGDAHLSRPEEAESYLGRIADELRASGIVVDSPHVHADPQADLPKAVAEHADELGQDLVVLCSHGRGGFKRFVFGNNAEQVLEHGETPVLLVHPDENGDAPPFGLERILVLLDGTRSTLNALDAGSTLAGATNARLHVLTVVPSAGSMSGTDAATRRFAPGATREFLRIAAEEAGVFLRSRIEEFTARGIRAGGRIEIGDGAEIFIRTALEVGADLAVLAVRGRADPSAFWADGLLRKVAAGFSGALLLIPIRTR